MYRCTCDKLCLKKNLPVKKFKTLLKFTTIYVLAVQTVEARSAQVLSQSFRGGRRLQLTGSWVKRQQPEHFNQRSEHHLPWSRYRAFWRAHPRCHEHKRFRNQGTVEFGEKNNQPEGEMMTTKCNSFVPGARKGFFLGEGGGRLIKLSFNSYGFLFSKYVQKLITQYAEGVKA